MSEPDAAGRDEALAAIRRFWPVSRETERRLDTHVALLRRWQAAKNLVGAATLAEIWTRHVLDSAQVLAVAPQARRIVDLGSGAGFPGLVLAILLAETPGARVTLIESNARKAAFLRTVIRDTGAPARVVQARIEDALDGFDEAVDLVTARALAPLAALLALAAPLLARGVPAIFHKGQDVEAELTAASTCWKIEASARPSLAHPDGCLLTIAAARPKADGAPQDTAGDPTP